MSFQSAAGGCVMCGADDDHANLLLCELCDAEYHTYCLGLRSVPQGDFYCDGCKREKKLHLCDDNFDFLVEALGPTYTSRFGEIIWAAGGVGFGWWPACIYDPRLTVGSARSLGKKHMGKKHLIYFFECHDAPFTVLTSSRICNWEDGLQEEYDLGRTARSIGKVRTTMFEQALQAANIEIGKPIELRLEWNHRMPFGTTALPPTTVNVPKKPTSEPVVIQSNKVSECNADNLLSLVGTSEKRKRGRPPKAASQTNVQEQQQPTRAVVRSRRLKDNETMCVQEALALANALELSKVEAAAAAAVCSADNHSDISSVEEELPCRPGTSSGAVVSRRENFMAALSCNNTNFPVTTDIIEQVDGPLFCKLLLKGIDTSDASLNIGFVTLSSRRDATFADVRKLVEEDLDDDCIPRTWKFFAPKLGPVSRKQERKLEILDFLCGTTSDARLGNGTSRNPLRVIMEDFSSKKIAASNCTNADAIFIEKHKKNSKKQIKTVKTV
eukprot:CAMPEP_0171299436 /NCGR_PEP_ID=MMETSP0816-20121228/8257_1 /TAXON_ID=420281 /ORGANISM="Proboscia inermis, Strain CCAP1064/1" /LENGTH=497 /DNA_ID=CAMNT_0011775233 /DNA_START=197 /DNA_END=1690 /DNA_ORIENTATION=-